MRMQTFFIALIIIWTFGFTNVTEVQAEDRTSTLLAALSKNGINVQEQTDYSNLANKLHSMKIDVLEPHDGSYPPRLRVLRMQFDDSGHARSVGEPLRPV